MKNKLRKEKCNSFCSRACTFTADSWSTAIHYTRCSPGRKRPSAPLNAVLPHQCISFTTLKFSQSVFAVVALGITVAVAIFLLFLLTIHHLVVVLCDLCPLTRPYTEAASHASWSGSISWLIRPTCCVTRDGLRSPVRSRQVRLALGSRRGMSHQLSAPTENSLLRPARVWLNTHKHTIRG